MHGPGGFVGEGGEEGIMHGAADLDNGPADELAEAGFVAYFGAEGDGADEDDLVAEDGDFEDWTCGWAMSRLNIKDGGKGRGGRCQPCFSQSFWRETQVLDGSISKMLPRRGTPFGWGMGWGIAAQSLFGLHAVGLSQGRQ